MSTHEWKVTISSILDYKYKDNYMFMRPQKALL